MCKFCNLIIKVKIFIIFCFVNRPPFEIYFTLLLCWFVLYTVGSFLTNQSFFILYRFLPFFKYSLLFFWNPPCFFLKFFKSGLSEQVSLTILTFFPGCYLGKCYLFNTSLRLTCPHIRHLAFLCLLLGAFGLEQSLAFDASFAIKVYDCFLII